MYLLLKRHIGKFEVEIQIYLDTWVNYPKASRGEANCGAECDVPVPGIPGTGNFHFFWWYLVL